MVTKEKIIVSIFLIFILLLSVNLFFYKNNEADLVEVLIPKGASPVKIARILKQENVISSQKYFLVLVKLYGYSSKLKAGLYEFNKNDNSFVIIKKLKNGDCKNTKITIPEGFSSLQIANLLEENNICNKDDFLNIVNKENLEGYLFPNTYFFFVQTDAETIIKTMTDEFDKFWDKDCQYIAQNLKLSKKDIITLASIVEKEAMSDEERPIIAGVFLNRLSKKMRLESCATVMYALGQQKQRLTFDDLKIDSKYNTYKYRGLPPRPICNPGAKAIKAVLEPIETNNLYFVSKGNGTHYFSSTFEQHVQNKKISKKKDIKK